jgi:LCP family protein required for cell wall assembly
MGVNITDVKYQTDNSRRSDFDWISILLILLAIGIIVGAIFFIFHFRESKIAQLVESKSILSSIIIEQNGENTESIFLGFYNPETGKLAMISIPERTRLKVDYEDKPAYDIVRNIYSRGGITVVRKTIEKLTESQFGFYLVFDLTDFEKLVDLLDGIEVNNIHSLNYSDVENKVFIKIRKGSAHIDGGKAKQLLMYKFGEDGPQMRLDNHKTVVESLLSRVDDVDSLLLDRRVVNKLMKNIETNFSTKDFKVLLQESKKVNSSRLLIYRMFGKSIVIKDEEFISPIENGEWLRERIDTLKKFINDEGPAPIGDQVNIEILNGSGNPGQAQSLRNYFLEYGFNVVHYGNALRNDYQNTMVIDRIGRPSLAKQIADIINCREVYTRIDKTLLVDVTIIIGNDFEGKVVR